MLDFDLRGGDLWVGSRHFFIMKEVYLFSINCFVVELLGYIVIGNKIVNMIRSRDGVFDRGRAYIFIEFVKISELFSFHELSILIRVDPGIKVILGRVDVLFIIHIVEGIILMELVLIFKYGVRFDTVQASSIVIIGVIFWDNDIVSVEQGFIIHDIIDPATKESGVITVKESSMSFICVVSLSGVLDEISDTLFIVIRRL
jgi:hypothetical protein